MCGYVRGRIIQQIFMQQPVNVKFCILLVIVIEITHRQFIHIVFFSLILFIFCMWVCNTKLPAMINGF